MINCIGSMFDSSGYSIHFRQLVNALNKLTPCKIITNLVPNWVREVNDQELEMIKRPEDFDTNLIITHPIYWRINAYAKHNIAYLVWEGDRIPKSFIEECLNPNIETIIVPSEHTKEAVINTTIELANYSKGQDTKMALMLNKIKVILHGVDTKLFYPKEVKKDKFTFILNKGFRGLEDRGGVQYFIKAYLEEFTDKDNVRAIIKINPAYGVPNIQQLLEKITDKREDLPELAFDVQNYEYSKLVDFYNQGDVFVSPTRAEAFNLPCAESLACGIAVICTGYGGQTDYVKDGVNGLYIDFDLKEVNFEIQYEGISWAIPKLDDLKKKLRYAFENQSKMKELGNVGIKDISWNITAKRILDLK